jgi:hypothetical protein
MNELNEFITQALSPALAISASGMLTLGMHNRLSVLGGRVRQLNREILELSDPVRIANLQNQVVTFIQRAKLIRNSLFLLYAAICMMVLTAFGLAISDLDIMHAQNIPIVTFLIGLGLIFVAVVMEALEVLLILRTLHLDVEGIQQFRDGR